jgi:serine/threonine-protein kinase HipA
MVNYLDIYLNDILVGVLTKLPDGRMVFSFDDGYVADGNRPILSQCYYAADKTFLRETRVYSIKLPPFFSNLLPEGPLRNYIAEAGHVKPTNEFDMLRLLGEDLPGAIIARSTALSKPKASGLPYAMKEIAQSIPPFRFSLAGAQLKFSGLMKHRGGLTIPSGGVGGDWIVKLPSPAYDHVPENEYAIMHMASEIGIPVPDVELVALNKIDGLPAFGKLRGSQALAVKRFDRNEVGKRIHIEDFAQVYGILPDSKYEGVSFNNITKMVWTLVGEEGLIDFIRRLTYTILTGNGDMHLKNWSLIYEDERTPKLSPAYDLLSTVPYITGDNLALKFVKTKNMTMCSIGTFEQLVEKTGTPKKLVINTVRDTTQKTLEVWKCNKKHYALPKDIDAAIDKHMMNTALVDG